MITTGDEELRNEAIVYRDQGKAGFLGGDHVRMGYAWRMSELHAAVGVIHLSHLDDAINTRRRVALRYDDTLASLPGMPASFHPCRIGLEISTSTSSFWLRVLTVASSTRALRANGRIAFGRGLCLAPPSSADLCRPRQGLVSGGG